MDSKKQKLLIEYLIASVDTFALCQGIVKPSYFDPEYRKSVKFIKDYYEKYHTTPDNTQIEAESGIALNKINITPDQVNYCADEIEHFCKIRALEHAVMEAPKHIKNGDFGTLESQIKEAITISLHRNLGLRYFDNVEERLERMSHENVTEGTEWKEVDDLLFGGISRKELLLVSANSGGGKSITLSNLAFNFALKNKNVLYISLELSEDVIAQRFDTMFTGISRRVWKQHVGEIVTSLTIQREQCGIIDIIQLPSGTTPNEIRAYLKEYYLHYDMMPDLLIVDYLDNLRPNEKVSADNIFEKDKLCSEQLRQILVDFNMFGATASQLNRSAVGQATHDHSHIAGGISKINVADVYWSIIMTDVMRAAGEIVFIMQKTRNSDGVGHTVQLKWDPIKLRITDRDDINTPLVLNKKSKPEVNDQQKKEISNSLLSLMDMT